MTLQRKSGKAKDPKILQHAKVIEQGAKLAQHAKLEPLNWCATVYDRTAGSCVYISTDGITTPSKRASMMESLPWTTPTRPCRIFEC